MGRRWGKSFLGANVIANVLARHGRVGWVSYNYKNSRPLWRSACQLVRPLPKYFSISEAEKVITTPRGGFMALYTGDNLAAMRGEAFHLVVLDECAYLKEEDVDEVVYPTLADYEGQLLAISSPKGLNWFADKWDAARKMMNEDSAAWRAPTTDNPNPRIQKMYQWAKKNLLDITFQQEWNALFVAPGGTVYQSEWFIPRYTTPIAHNAVMERWISWDTALKEKEQNDFSSYVVGEVSPDYKLHTVYVWKGHLAFPDLPSKMVEVAERWNSDGKLTDVIIEDKGSGTSAIQMLQASAPEWLRGKIRAFDPKGDKVARANEAALWCKMGCVTLPPVGEEWLFEFERNLFAFPGVVHDDDVDAFDQLIISASRYLERGLSTTVGQYQLQARKV